MLRLRNIAHVPEFLASQQTGNLTGIHCLEVSLLSPQPDSSYSAHWSPRLREGALASLLRLLWRCTNLTELRLLDVQSFTEIFNPLEEMTEA